MEQVRTRDGAISVHSTGSGPGIVVVHGGGVTIDIYRRFAAALADRFTVHLYNRRGRPGSPPRQATNLVEEDVDDLAAVLEHTGTGNVIGHSIGGFMALQAALRLPIERLALYDGVVPLESGGIPLDWLDTARDALAVGDTPRALAITAAGINGHMATARLPFWVQLMIVRLLLRTEIGRTMGDLLPATLDEDVAVLGYKGPADQWAGVTAELLLARGARSAPYYDEIYEALARVLPQARTLRIPRSGHDAINRAHQRVVDPIAGFFAGSEPGNGRLV